MRSLHGKKRQFVLQSNEDFVILHHQSKNQNDMRTKSIFGVLALAGAMMLMGCEQKKSDAAGNEVAADSTGVESVAVADSVAANSDGVEVTAGSDRVRAVKDGKPFTGEIWSEDGKTYVMKFKDGKSYEGILYHKNGKPAMVEGENGKCYDEDGSVLSAEEFTVKYYKYLEESGSQIEGVFAKMKNMK